LPHAVWSRFPPPGGPGSWCCRQRRRFHAMRLPFPPRRKEATAHDDGACSDSGSSSQTSRHPPRRVDRCFRARLRGRRPRAGLPPVVLCRDATVGRQRPSTARTCPPSGVRRTKRALAELSPIRRTVRGHHCGPEAASPPRKEKLHPALEGSRARRFGFPPHALGQVCLRARATAACAGAPSASARPIWLSGVPERVRGRVRGRRGVECDSGA